LKEVLFNQSRMLRLKTSFREGHIDRYNENNLACLNLTMQM